MTTRTHDAIATGTVNPANYFARSDVAGRVAEGYDADLVLLRANPLERIDTLREPLGVMARGRWLSETELREGLARIAARNRAD